MAGEDWTGVVLVRAQQAVCFGEGPPRCALLWGVPRAILLVVGQEQASQCLGGQGLGPRT